MTSTIGGLVILFLLYASGAIFVIVMLAVGIAWGIRWGLTWTLREISRDPGIEKWLKRVLSSSENQINSDILKSSSNVSNQPN